MFRLCRMKLLTISYSSYLANIYNILWLHDIETLSTWMVIFRGIHQSPHTGPLVQSCDVFIVVILNNCWTVELPMIWEDPWRSRNVTVTVTAMHRCGRNYDSIIITPCCNYISSCIWIKDVTFRFHCFAVLMIFKSCLAQCSCCLTFFAFNIFVHTGQHRTNLISYISCL